MNEFIGKDKKVRIRVLGARGERLIFSGYILEESPTLIKFKDKFGVTQIFSKSEILKVDLVKGDERT